MSDPWAFRFLGLTLLLLATATGCDLQFTDPYGSAPADLLVQLRIREGPPEAASLTGHFSPGQDRDGRAREVEDDAVGILGIRISPGRVGGDGARVYSHEWALPVGEPVPEPRLRGPRVTAAGGPDPGIRFGTCVRSDPADLVASPGDTLRFEVSCEPSGEGLRHTEWQLEVRRKDGDGLVFFLHASSAPPPAITIQADWLEQVGDPDLEALLTVTRVLVVNDRAEHDYRIAMTVRWEFPWSIRWTDPS